MKTIHKLGVIAVLLVVGICMGGGTFVLPPSQKQPKVSVDECCDEIGFYLELHSHMLQREGKVQELLINHFKDAAAGEKKSVLTRASQRELQDYYCKVEEHNEYRKAYLKHLDEFMHYLQDSEKKFLKSGLKKS